MLEDKSGTKITSHRGSSVGGVSPAEIEKMLIFIAGGVRTWCKAVGDKQFALRDLFGGENYYWEGTPLQALYVKFCNEGYSSDEAVRLAGNAAGRLLKRVLVEDRTRTYVVGDAGLANGYTWKM